MTSVTVNADCDGQTEEVHVYIVDGANVQDRQHFVLQNGESGTYELSDKLQVTVLEVDKD